MNAGDRRNNSLNELCESVEDLLQTIFGLKFYNNAKTFALTHPFIFAAIFFICLFSLVPMLVFLAFVVTTLFIALLCFLCIEGSIIALGGIIFIGVVFFISVIVASIVSAIAVAYLCLERIRMIFKSCHFPCSSPQAVETVGSKDD